MGIRELWEKHKKEKEEEEEYEKRRKKGEVPVEELSPREQREHIETAKRISEEAAKAVQKARRGERKRAPKIARERIEAKEEAVKAEERARTLETELYGEPHVRPEEVIRDRWGKEIGRQPLTAKRREEAARLELAQQRMTERGVSLAEARFREAEEALKEKRTARRRQKVLGPAREVARGVAGVVAGVGRAGAGFKVRTEPYKMKPLSLLPTTRPTPTAGPPRPALRPTTSTAFQAPDLSALRRLQTQPISTGTSLFPTRQLSTMPKDIAVLQAVREIEGTSSPSNLEGIASEAEIPERDALAELRKLTRIGRLEKIGSSKDTIWKIRGR